jgi:hypothetical protein
MDVFASIEDRSPDRPARIPVIIPTTLSRTRLTFEHVIICSMLVHDDDDNDSNKKFLPKRNHEDIKEE